MSTEVPDRNNIYYFWLDTGQSGNVWAVDTNDALDQVKTLYPHSTVKRYGHLPYPANRDLIDPPPQWKSHPRFCYTPHDCAGLNSCPRIPACSE
jgi:hypothetical protein